MKHADTHRLPDKQNHNMLIHDQMTRYDHDGYFHNRKALALKSNNNIITDASWKIGRAHV